MSENLPTLVVCEGKGTSFTREYISLIDDDLEDDDDDIQLQDALVSSWKDDTLEPRRCVIMSII